MASCVVLIFWQLNTATPPLKDLAQPSGLQVKIGGRWGTVCGAGGFSDAAAGVVCRKLGLSKTGKARAGGVFPPGKLPIMLAGLRCKGSESELSGCTFSTMTSKCKHGQDVGVVCKRKWLGLPTYTVC